MAITEILKNEDRFKYQLLDRMRMDCDYFLGNGNRHNKYLWAGDPITHIEYMQAIYKSFKFMKKPRWITKRQIKKYKKEMCKDGGIN